MSVLIAANLEPDDPDISSESRIPSPFAFHPSMNHQSPVHTLQASEELRHWVRDAGRLYDTLTARLQRMKKPGPGRDDRIDRDCGFFDVTPAMAKWLEKLQGQTARWIWAVQNTTTPEGLCRVSLWSAYGELLFARQRRRHALLVLEQRLSKPMVKKLQDGKALSLE
ncbi:MAG: hypothetical protein LQ350_005469 [Teloschistes chrysophthalmus]|nr:MAG: hypothetical protein LQ350_005469 [Niorma chrysophthalma]